MAVIDSHAHIYPNKIAARAVSAISQFYNIPMENQHGTPEALLAECEGTPITHFIVHSVATTAHAVTSINNRELNRTLRFEPRYFITKGRLERWVYSTPQCRKHIETHFG